MFERIVAKWIEEVMNSNTLSENQYGFRKGRSTTDAVNRVINLAKDAISGKRRKRGKIEYCVLVALDIKNAFNSAKLDSILNAIKQIWSTSIPDSFDF